MPGESQDGEPDGLPPMGSHRVRHDGGDLAAAASGGAGTPRSFTVRVPVVDSCVAVGFLP